MRLIQYWQVQCHSRSSYSWLINSWLSSSIDVHPAQSIHDHPAPGQWVMIIQLQVIDSRSSSSRSLSHDHPALSHWFKIIQLQVIESWSVQLQGHLVMVIQLQVIDSWSSSSISLSHDHAALPAQGQRVHGHPAPGDWLMIMQLGHQCTFSSRSSDPWSSSSRSLNPWSSSSRSSNPWSSSSRSSDPWSSSARSSNPWSSSSRSSNPWSSNSRSSDPWSSSSRSSSSLTHSKFIGTCHYKYFKISTASQEHWKNYTGFLSDKESTPKPVFSHTKHLQINNLHIFTIVFHSRSHSVSITIFWFACSFHSICPIITWQKGFLCHRSTPQGIHSPRYPKLIFSTNIPFQTQNTPLQNCVPSLGSFPSPWTVYPDFDSCYSHFMPYRMTPSVRHRAIEVHYKYYYYLIHDHPAQGHWFMVYRKEDNLLCLQSQPVYPLKHWHCPSTQSPRLWQFLGQADIAGWSERQQQQIWQGLNILVIINK